MFYNTYAPHPKQKIEIDDFVFKLYQKKDHFIEVNRWLKLPYAQYWRMQNSTDDFRQESLEANDHQFGLIGYRENKIICYTELYDPRFNEVGSYYDVEDGDCGMHLIIAPVEIPQSGFSLNIISTITTLILKYFNFKRMVVEPDENNKKIHNLNHKIGIYYSKKIQLSYKTALLGFCKLQDFKNNEVTMKNTNLKKANEYVLSQDKATWELANRHLVRKIISELSHETLINIEAYKDNLYQVVVPSDHQDIIYRFKAKPYLLDHYHIDAHSIVCYNQGHEEPLDAIQLILRLKNILCIQEKILPTYLEEITSTLYSKAYKSRLKNIPVAELAQLDYQSIEAAMSEGHPVFIANNGRIGFDAGDFLTYTPESAEDLQLVWLAVSRDRTVFETIEGLTHEDLLKQELGDAQYHEFQQTIRLKNKEPEDYYFVPVHPWQWKEKITRLFTADIVNDHVIYLGLSQDTYQAQQSIRTFFNLDQQHKCYVKTALSILNMGFMRGLPPHYMERTPDINTVVADLVDHDPFFDKYSFFVLKEIAAIGYHHFYYKEAITYKSPYNKMLSALWRESPFNLCRNGKAIIEPQQKLVTLAALLHQDTTGKSLISAFIEDSKLNATAWVNQFISLYLQPILHAFYKHDLIFMPHGENIIMVMEESVPVKMLMKDIGEEVAFLNTDKVLTGHLSEIKFDVENDIKINHIFLDIFDCIFRFIVPLLEQDTDVSELDFWTMIIQQVQDYQAQFPELKDKFEQYDLFMPDFHRVCLNAIQINDNQQMIDLEDPEKNLKFSGRISNPLYIIRNILLQKSE